MKGIVGTIRIQTVSDRKVARIWMVTNRAYKNRDGEPVIEETWHNVSAWEGREIQNLEQIRKGTPLHVIGRMRSQQYTSADGSERYSYDVSALKLAIINLNDEFLCES